MEKGDLTKEFYVVYSGSEKWDLSDVAKPSAIFTYVGHAKSLITSKWPGWGYYKEIHSKKELIDLIEKEF